MHKSIERSPFRKSYLEGWSEQIFYIELSINGTSVVHKFKDQPNESITGTFKTMNFRRPLNLGPIASKNVNSEKRPPRQSPVSC